MEDFSLAYQIFSADRNLFNTNQIINNAEFKTMIICLSISY